jgi:hypothetical protein
MPRDVCMAVPDLHSFPNLKALLREDNTPLLAYLRFAQQPWRIREFYRMLCPTADDRELEVFEDWARTRGKKGAPVRPPSRGCLPALPQPKVGPPLSAPASPAILEGVLQVEVFEEVTEQGSLLGENLEYALVEEPEESPAEAVVTVEAEAAVTAEEPLSYCGGRTELKVRALRGLPPRIELAPEPRPEAQIAAETAAMQEQVKRYVQQRYLELMMVEGMEPNAACALALREAPAVLAQGQHLHMACGPGDSPKERPGDRKLSARSVCA